MQRHGRDALGCAAQRECGVTKPLRVAPLFETLDDLDHSESAMEQLLSNKWCARRAGPCCTWEAVDGAAGRREGRARCLLGHVAGPTAGRARCCSSHTSSQSIALKESVAFGKKEN
jgi:hypothetical protein